MILQTIEELAAKRLKWIEANRENGFEAGIKRLLTELYPDNAHFIYELLQNAEDAQAQEVRFILGEDRIEFEHDGKKFFSIKDVNAITSIGYSTKTDDATNIGKFGVGFKAVFAYTDSPEIVSDDFQFRIVDMVVPEKVLELKHRTSKGITKFILPFNNQKKKPASAIEEIEKLLKTLQANTLLFLKNLKKIEYILSDLTIGFIERIEISDNLFEIQVQQPHQSSPISTWFLKFDKDIDIIDEEENDESVRNKICRIAVAFGVLPFSSKDKSKKSAEDEIKQPDWELIPIEHGSVCIYFPADKETSNLHFHIHAPFASTVARDSVRDCKGNHLLRDHLAELLSESMHKIRDQKLLTVQCLALLPNDKDNLKEFYEPLMDRLVQEFKEHDLVPMKRGGHAAASGIFRGTKAFSDLISDDDFAMLLGDDFYAPMWVANPSQRNQREDNFLSMLDINPWTIADLVNKLDEVKEEIFKNWIEGKSDKWHHDLFRLLLDYLNAPTKRHFESIIKRDRVNKLTIIRCSDGIYRNGRNCYFPTQEVEFDNNLPRVEKSMYTSDNKIVEYAYEFLLKIGVREVDKKIEMESLLKSRYSSEAIQNNMFKPKIDDMVNFINLFRENSSSTEIFRNYYIFKLENNKWGKAHDLYLDSPYIESGLSEWHELQGESTERQLLSRDYLNLKINPDLIGEFAANLGALTTLQIVEQSARYHLQYHILFQRGGQRYTGSGVDSDYHIPKLKEFLSSPSLVKSKLVWSTMIECCSDNYGKYFRARFGLNASNINDLPSTLICDLCQNQWVPQKSETEIQFVKPREAIAEKLPGGFEFQTGWQWLRAIEFGKSVESRNEKMRLENESLKQIQEWQLIENKRKESVAKDLGFDSQEEAKEVAQLIQKDPTGFKKWKNSFNKTAIFPSKSIKNPVRRQERVQEDYLCAPLKEFETRKRSVSVSNGPTDEEIKLWLRHQYTNDDGEMVCQICKEEMPFRKRSGEHYFEKKEVLSLKYLPKKHVAQYLALCPLCAAMYTEFVIGDDDVMSEIKVNIIKAEKYEIPIFLNGQETCIRFVETHFYDLKAIFNAMALTENQ